MEAQFSIWWVISIGCLLLFILSALLRQRKALAEGLGSDTFKVNSLAPTRVLGPLKFLEQRLDDRPLVASYGFSPLFVHDVRAVSVGGENSMGSLPDMVKGQLSKVYADGSAFGADVTALLRGESLGADKTLYFALVVHDDREQTIAFVN